jgi:hypothetical protein
MSRFPVGRSILLGCTALVVGLWWTHRPLHHPPGVLVTEPPMQVNVPAGELATREGFRLTAVARYALRGRVLGTKRYHGGVQAPLVPVDVAIGWGRMSDQAVLDQLDVTMGNRFFFYEWRGSPPIPQDEIKCSAANNHVISATDQVRSRIAHLRIGQIVELQGWLVDADGPNGFHWPTSRRRDDTGNGACELFYVEEAQAWDEPPTFAMKVPVSPNLAASRPGEPPH